MRENDRQRPLPQAEADGIIEGRNAVIEALRSGENIDKIYLAKGETDKTLGHIASRAREKGIVVVEADRRKLDGMSRTHAHQGVIALAAMREYVTVQSLLDTAEEKGEAPLLVVCDEISDPHNLGAILRTAECAGAHGVIIPKRRSAGASSSAGFSAIDSGFGAGSAAGSSSSGCCGWETGSGTGCGGFTAPVPNSARMSSRSYSRVRGTSCRSLPVSSRA